jgi:hypothetical protein
LFEIGWGGEQPVRKVGPVGNPPEIDDVSFLVEGVDTLHDELVACGVQIAGEPRDQLLHDWLARRVASERERIALATAIEGVFGRNATSTSLLDAL